MGLTAGRVLKLIVFAAGAGIAAFAARKVIRRLRRNKRAKELFNTTAEYIDQEVGWSKLPTIPAVGVLVGLRNTLREKNLYDTSSPEIVEMPYPVPRDLRARRPDGTYNDLEVPCMGSAGTRFGRNVPISETYPDESNILKPNPRSVSLELMTRHTFQPATTLNLLAAAWLQFMIRDWFSHGKSAKENPFKLPLPEGDDWHENPMQILRTMDDHTLAPSDAGLPPTHINTETHWWDASQLYGSNLEFQKRVRTLHEGRVHLDRNDLVSPDDTTLVQTPALAGWWVGLEMMFSLFALEHNAICDALVAEYPAWDDEKLFQHARLINAALLAKIHTVEWTTAILGHPALQIAMRANWWGIATEQVHKLLGRISSSEIISGIPGSQTDHFGVPYAITEEFVAVYKMHPLIPDDYEFRCVLDDALLEKLTLPEIAGQHSQPVCERLGMTDLLYSFGRMNPGAITLHNFPVHLQKFTRPDGIVIDLAAHDILRSRELGVPRYNQFRRLLHKKPLASFAELTTNSEWAAEIERVYEGDIEMVDLTVGLFAEDPPPGFGFSDTAFRIFILMASRRLNSDRFFTNDFTPEVYSKVGMKWIDDNSFSTVLLRHFPDLEPALKDVRNPFAPWSSTQP